MIWDALQDGLELEGAMINTVVTQENAVTLQINGAMYTYVVKKAVQQIASGKKVFMKVAAK
ncbi:hypothetical protein GOP56_05160 [Brevibacillus sp. 7WMA2]|uniref:hypothetical protein n=1 Tax=Brevibacillus sp. 7WMA2 TaxID=2683193 RepID=UPI0013A772C0|nr:hypothetical protein [Brevibacillus sp. 7WMA2]QIC05034.1 hypothetical protein GOP56_05160 [Brevibacillus sp. 7WMA2]WPS85833.1 hypothetical protein SMD22_15010 [Brevibacillus halotolerans]